MPPKMKISKAGPGGAPVRRKHTTAGSSRLRSYTVVGFLNDDPSDKFAQHVEAANPSLAKDRAVEAINDDTGRMYELDGDLVVVAVFEGHLEEVGDF
jgi:hypothetical protein